METQQNLVGNKPRFNIGFFFLCLGVLISLITSVVSFLNLVFATLDKRFPDVLNANYQYGYNTYDYEAIRTALATLIIFFPVFLTISYFWKKYTKGVMGHVDEIIRKWVIYIILFLSAIVIVVDLVTLVRYFISGEITNRFILKVVSALLVATLVGVYYILALKREKNAKGNIGLFFGGIGIILVILSIAYSFAIMGSPKSQRLLRLDDKRVGDLQNIQYQVINYWQQKEKLPAALTDLSNPISGYSIPVDPEFETGKAYTYTVKDANKLTFELCADFSMPMPQGWRESQNYGGVMPMMPVSSDVKTSYPYPGTGTNESWDHQVGHTCYTRTIDTDIYPPFPKPAKTPNQ